MSGLQIEDGLVIAFYLVGVLAIGTLAGRMTSLRSLSDFFLGGRKLPWWLLGTSMVATTLAADTPLAVAGITLNDGVAGNWFWWSSAVSHVLVSVALAKLWQRAGVITDAELCELRYQGPSAGLLRTVKAFYDAIPVNGIIMGWVFLAMAKVGNAIFPDVPSWQIVGGLLALTLVYSVRSGFMGVVVTDLVQFPIALLGTVALAWVVVANAGGLGEVVEAAVARGGPEAIALFPLGGDLLPWHTLLAFLAVQWWAQRGSDGGGLIAQRLLSARSERDAELGALWFCVAHYILRPWPWILTGMAAIVLLSPEQIAADPEGTYPTLIMTQLPPGLRGLLVAAFLAAFMSTIDTHLNWGASYVTNDLVARRWTLSPARLLAVSRASVLVIALLALGISLAMDSIAGAWRLLLALGAGTGAVILLRWYWWRISAVTELAALLGSSVLAGVAYLAFDDWTYLAKLCLIAGGSALVWLPTTIWWSPDPHALAAFYRRVRPPGPGWRTVARVLGEADPEPLAPHLIRWLVALAGVLGCLLGLGKALLGAPVLGTLAVAVGIACLWWVSTTHTGAVDAAAEVARAG